MINDKEKTLEQALNDAFIFQLPDKWDNKSIWIYAIGLVTHSNARQTYCLVKRDNNGNPQIIKTYGEPCRIVMLNEIYPYIFLQDKYHCDFKNKQERIDYIIANNNAITESELQVMKKPELENECINIWIKEQLQTK